MLLREQLKLMKWVKSPLKTKVNVCLDEECKRATVASYTTTSTQSIVHVPSQKFHGCTAAIPDKPFEPSH